MSTRQKLLIITISIMIILALSSSVMAKAVQLDLEPRGLEEGWGNAILNNPAGTVDLILLVNIKKAVPERTYVVQFYAMELGGMVPLGTIVTNKAGNGSFKLNVKDFWEGSQSLSFIWVSLWFEGFIMYSNNAPGEIEIK